MRLASSAEQKVQEFVLSGENPRAPDHRGGGTPFHGLRASCPMVADLDPTFGTAASRRPTSGDRCRPRSSTNDHNRPLVFAKTADGSGFRHYCSRVRTGLFPRTQWHARLGWGGTRADDTSRWTAHPQSRSRRMTLRSGGLQERRIPRQRFQRHRLRHKPWGLAPRSRGRRQVARRPARAASMRPGRSGCGRRDYFIVATSFIGGHDVPQFIRSVERLSISGRCSWSPRGRPNDHQTRR